MGPQRSNSGRVKLILGYRWLCLRSGHISKQETPCLNTDSMRLHLGKKVITFAVGIIPSFVIILYFVSNGCCRGLHGSTRTRGPGTCSGSVLCFIGSIGSRSLPVLLPQVPGLSDIMCNARVDPCRRVMRWSCSATGSAIKLHLWPQSDAKWPARASDPTQISNANVNSHNK